MFKGVFVTKYKLLFIRKVCKSSQRRWKTEWNYFCEGRMRLSTTLKSLFLLVRSSSRPLSWPKPWLTWRPASGSSRGSLALPARARRSGDVWCSRQARSTDRCSYFQAFFSTSQHFLRYHDGSKMHTGVALFCSYSSAFDLSSWFAVRDRYYTRTVTIFRVSSLLCNPIFSMVAQHDVLICLFHQTKLYDG